MRTLVVSAIFLGSVLFSTPIFAQTFTVDVAGISDRCSYVHIDCSAGIIAEVARLRAAGLPPAQADSQLGVIVGTAITAAAALPATERAELAGTIRTVASSSSNPVQQQALRRLARDLQTGASVDLIAVASALSAN